jgi:hypothetical protein
MAKRYIGDGVYANFDGYNFILTTENGISVTNTIVLEPGVVATLQAYIAQALGSDDDLPAVSVLDEG